MRFSKSKNHDTYLRSQFERRHGKAALDAVDNHAREFQRIYGQEVMGEFEDNARRALETNRPR